jgi:hypothetical protein
MAAVPDDRVRAKYYGVVRRQRGGISYIFLFSETVK